MTLTQFTEGMAILVKYSPEIEEEPFRDADSDVIAIRTSELGQHVSAEDQDALHAIGFYYDTGNSWWFFYV